MANQDIYERERKRMLVGLQYQKQKPGSIADRAFYRNLFGDHPYAADPSGTEVSVAALTGQDLRSFYRRYYVASNAVVVIVGDVSVDHARQLAARLSGSLEQGEPASALPEVKTPADANEVFIEHPSSQSHVLMGAPGVQRKDPDYFPLYVGNHILGGSGLVSRINEEIREKRGLSYSAYSYFQPMRENGPFILGLQTRNDQVETALTVLKQTLAEFVAKGPTEKELQASKKNITGGFPLRIDSNKDLVEYAAMIGFYGLPLDYLDTFNAQVEALTVEQIRAAFQRRVKPEQMVTVVVGNS